MRKAVISPSTPPWTRSGYMNVIIRFLRQADIDPVEVVGPEGLRIAEAADPYRKVDLLTVLQVFRKAARVTGRSDIALELGLKEPLEEWGPFIFLFVNAPTVGEAFKDLCRYGAVLQSQAHFQLVADRQQFSIEYSSNHPELLGWDLDGEITVALVMRMVNGLTDTVVTPSEVVFEHQPTCDLARYRKWLRVKPRFGAATNAVIYPAELADRALPNANPSLYKVLKRHMQDLTEAEIFEDQLHHFVRNNIGRGLSPGTATLEHIAAVLGLEPRTLQRRLRKEGTSFQALTDEVRQARAIYFLRKTRLSIAEIAHELGYAESSAFIRSFKRRTGKSPGRFRQATEIRSRPAAN